MDRVQAIRIPPFEDRYAHSRECLVEGLSAVRGTNNFRHRLDVGAMVELRRGKLR